DDLARAVAQQCAALAAVAHAEGVAVTAVKLHGALYHDAQRDRARAERVLAAAAAGLGLGVADGERLGHPHAPVVIGPAAGAMREAAEGLGLDYAREAFADRGVRADGSLVPR